MKNSKKEKHKGQIIALILSIIVLVSGLYAIYQSINSPKSEHISLQMYSKNSNGVFNEISAAIYKEFYISSNTVCTDSFVKYDKNGKVTYIDMLLWDRDSFKEISVKYWLHDEKGTPQTSITMIQKDNDLNIDGILFNKYINFLSTEDIGKIVKISGSTTDFGYAINNNSSMWKTIEENDTYEIGPENYSYLYKNGDIVSFTNANQIEGKLFEVAVLDNIENDTENSLQGSCAIINIPR